MKCLTNFHPAKIWLQFLGKSDRAISLLAGLDQRREQSWKCGARSVQRMTKAIFSVGIFVAKIHPARLKLLEVGTTRNFQIRVLTRRPDFDVIGFRRTKT